MLRGRKPKIKAIPASPTSVKECFHEVLEHEMRIHECVHIAFDEKD